MDWDRAISRNRTNLLRIVAALFFYAGLDEGGADVVPRRVWRRIVLLLRPAEAAARRLIILAASGITLPPLSPLAAGSEGRVETRGSTPQSRSDRGGNSISAPDTPLCRLVPTSPPQGGRVALFRLTDLPRRFDIEAWNNGRPFPEGGFELADADEEVNARPLSRRILSLKAALDDIEGHAKRLARWKARQARLPVTVRRFSPIRRGHPPGHCKRPTHEIDDILSELHDLAAYALRLDPG